jgi:Ni,Fe-hydrogenase III large subunit
VNEWITIANGAALETEAVPRRDPASFFEAVRQALSAGGRMVAFFGLPDDPQLAASPDATRLVAVMATQGEPRLRLATTSVRDGFPSLTPEFPQLHRFEREVHEQWGLVPDEHPWLKPVRFQKPYRVPAGRSAQVPTIGVTDFFRVSGREIHEVAVGPVHAGIIEPGHFRFQCHGEHVLHLEIALGYQHRGVERALVGGPDRRTRHYIETAAGDTSVGHGLAYARIREALAGARVRDEAHALRAVALELERLACHTGDLGALAGDVAFLPTASYCGRIRGDFLNMTALLCGNRFGRGLVVPGGLGFDLDAERVSELLRRIDAAEADVTSAVELLWSTPSVMARFQGTGAISGELARAMGFVGVAARAAGVPRDVRHELPVPGQGSAELPLRTSEAGDVHARALVRWREIQDSLAFVRQRATALAADAARSDVGPPRPGRIAVALVEGWRGEICHVAVTDADGRFAGYKIVDPSFHNWAALAHALRDQQISDFPLCNKSFDLSYCGQDL